MTADILSYDQDQNILEAKGKVKIEDKVEKYILEAEYINYNRNSEKIFTKNKTKILIDSKYEFNSKDVFLNRKLKELKSDSTSTVKDNNLNFYKLSKFILLWKKLLRGNDVEVQTNYEKENDNFYFENAFINLLDNSFMSKDTKLNIHKEIFDKERDLEDDQKIYLREKMIHVYGVSSMEMRILLF